MLTHKAIEETRISYFYQGIKNSRAEYQRVIFNDLWYNPRRRHSTLGGKSPLAFERQVA
jgi:transposase InsO family protein